VTRIAGSRPFDEARHEMRRRSSPTARNVNGVPTRNDDRHFASMAGLGAGSSL